MRSSNPEFSAKNIVIPIFLTELNSEFALRVNTEGVILIYWVGGFVQDAWNTTALRIIVKSSGLFPRFAWKGSEDRLKFMTCERWIPTRCVFKGIIELHLKGDSEKKITHCRITCETKQLQEIEIEWNFRKWFFKSTYLKNNTNLYLYYFKSLPEGRDFLLYKITITGLTAAAKT